MQPKENIIPIDTLSGYKKGQYYTISSLNTVINSFRQMNYNIDIVVSKGHSHLPQALIPQKNADYLIAVNDILLCTSILDNKISYIVNINIEHKIKPFTGDLCTSMNSSLFSEVRDSTVLKIYNLSAKESISFIAGNYALKFICDILESNYTIYITYNENFFIICNSKKCIKITTSTVTTSMYTIQIPLYSIFSTLKDIRTSSSFSTQCCAAVNQLMKILF